MIGSLSTVTGSKVLKFKLEFITYLMVELLLLPSQGTQISTTATSKLKVILCIIDNCIYLHFNQRC